MSNMVTRCPKCATSFRITSAQLQSAKGAVRCGSCLHIFKAQDHLVGGEAPAPAKPAAPVAPRAQPSAPARTNSDTAKPAATNKPASRAEAPTKPLAPVKPASPAAAKAPAPPVQPGVRPTAPGQAPKMMSASKPAAAAPTNSPKPAADKLVFNQSQIDEEIAALGDDDDILISDDMDQRGHKPSGDASEYDEFLNMDAKPKQGASLFERNKRREDRASEDNTDESWAENLLEEAEDDQRLNALKRQIAASENQPKKTNPSEGDQAQANQATEFKGHVFSLISDESTSQSEQDEHNFREIFTEEELSDELRAIDRNNTHAIDQSPTNESPMHAYDTSRAALLMNIMPEPVVMTSRRKPHWQRRKLWGLLSLLMILVLFIQVAWLQFHSLSRIQPYRAGYEFICPMLGCRLPVLIDRELIRVRNLVVRKHPDIDNALIVDVILINTAPFRQPFPDLVMAFSDIDEKPVAARRFSPREYLGGELAGLNLIPQNQPVHISLELVDPGETAVNYKIEPY